MSKKKKAKVMFDDIEFEVEEIEFKHPGADLTEDDLKNMESPSLKVTCKLNDTSVNKIRYDMWKAKNKIPEYKES